MVKVLYFAKYREAAGVDSDQLEVEQAMPMAQVLGLVMKKRGAEFEAMLADEKVLTALNQEMVEADVMVNPGDEVAIFPPVTGG